MKQVDIIHVFDSAGDSQLSAGAKDRRIEELEAENERLRGLLRRAAGRIQRNLIEREGSHANRALH